MPDSVQYQQCRQLKDEAKQRADEAEQGDQHDVQAPGAGVDGCQEQHRLAGLHRPKRIEQYRGLGANASYEAIDPPIPGDQGRVSWADARRSPRGDHRGDHDRENRDQEGEGRHHAAVAEGQVEAGEPVELIERPSPEWSVTRATRAMQRRSTDKSEAAALLQVPALSDACRKILSH